MFKRSLIIIVLTLLLIGGLAAAKFMQIRHAMSQIKPPPPAMVAVTEVKAEQWISAINAVGSLEAVSAVAVSSEVNGKIKALHFDSGQSVKKGQLLVELDRETDQAELQALIANQQLARIRFQRSEKMLTNKFVSQADYDQNKALLDETEALVQAKQAAIAKKRIVAPFSGELGIRKVDIGQYLAPGAAIVDLQQRDPIYLDFSIPERFISQLANGQPLSATVQAYPDKRFDGKIVAINPAIDSKTRSVKIRAMLENAEKRLHSGMFAQVKLDAEHGYPVLTLPDTAITYNPYGNSVFLIENRDNSPVVQNRQVKTGQTRQGRVEIIEGLAAGDRVVSAGQVKLRNGMAVTVDTQPAPGEQVR